MMRSNPRMALDRELRLNPPGPLADAVAREALARMPDPPSRYDTWKSQRRQAVWSVADRYGWRGGHSHRDVIPPALLAAHDELTEKLLRLAKLLDDAERREWEAHYGVEARA